MSTISQQSRRAMWAHWCSGAILIALIGSTTAFGDTQRESMPIGAPGAAAAVPVGTPSTFRTVISLGVVVCLIVGGGVGVRVLAKMGVGKALGAAAGSPSGVVEVLARYPGGRGLTLVVLKIDRRVLLLGQVASTTGRVESVNTLTTFDDATDVASLLSKTQDEQGHSLSAKFREMMSGLSGSGPTMADDEADIRDATQGADGDEVQLIDDRSGHAGAENLGAFRRSVSAIRETGARR